MPPEEEKYYPGDIFVIEDVLLNKIVHIKSVDLKYDHRALIQNKLSALESPRG